MIKVVIVEDNRDILNAISSLLTITEGYECIASFENAEDAEKSISPSTARCGINRHKSSWKKWN
jgi:YesN/AraC family two-component response regulator